jgi:hypothetical protein
MPLGEHPIQELDDAVRWNVCESGFAVAGIVQAASDGR